MRFDFLTKSFLRFLHVRKLHRQFMRYGPDMFGSTPGPTAMTARIDQHLMHLVSLDKDALLSQLQTSHEGLHAADAASRLAEKGPNEVAHERPLPWWRHLWHCYANPFNLLLTLLAVISYYTEDLTAAIIIGAMVILSTLLRFVQETRSNQAAASLQALVSNTATVLRRATPDGTPTRMELPMKVLVPGDMILLSAGDMIPADLRLLSAKDLFINQSAMTGESLPVEKFPDAGTGTSFAALERPELCFMGTNVVSGTATAVVISTGAMTYFGALAERVIAPEQATTSFQKGVNQVSWLLIRFMLVMTPIVLLLNGFTKGDWLEAFLFSLSVAVGLTPEMLPMIVTSTLAKGAIFLSRRKVIVKRLDAIQNFGAMDVLCTDKTGTLTQDKIFLERHTDILGQPDENVLSYAYLNSYYQTGLKNLLDVAVLEHRDLQSAADIVQHYEKIDEIPFDFQRRRMSVIVSKDRQEHILICKGALEEIIALCTHASKDGHTVPLDQGLLSSTLATTASLNAQGLRVVAVAFRKISSHKDNYGVTDEAGMTLAGYIAFLDPPKESTAPALAALRRHGITVKILTGDNELVTAKICQEVGLETQGMLLGSQVDSMDDTALAQAVRNTTVFAKLSPAHKERIVRVLHDNGHVVGFMGDGINDAPALRAADIGISVDTAVDIAKEAADLILLEKSLMVLEQGVIEGRRTFANMLKYIKMTASSNFGNVFSVLVASAFLPFLPMLPLHLLIQNLLYDISQTAIPFDQVDPEFLQHPQRWDANEIGRFMVCFGPISSLFDILTFCLMWYVFQANTPEQQTLFQSGWFVVGLLSQTLIVHMIRTRRIPFLQSRAAWPLTVMTLLIMGIGIILPLSPVAPYLDLQPLPLAYYGWLVVILLGYALATQLMKTWYSRRYGWQ